MSGAWLPYQCVWSLFQYTYVLPDRCVSVCLLRFGFRLVGLLSIQLELTADAPLSR